MLIISRTVQYIPGKVNAEGFYTSASLGGRPFCNLRFADDIDLLAGSDEEHQQLTNSLKD